MKFNIYTLGCKVNTYESNVMADHLKGAGYIEVSTDEPADISIINTCTVTNMADSKSRKTIHHAKKSNPNSIIVVVGCMTQNKKDDIEDADIILGNINKSKIVDYIEEYKKNHQHLLDIQEMKNLEFESMQLNNFNKTRAFVKIQDGCNNYCSYCVIPYTRGNVRSKKREDVLKEVQTLIEKGHKEIVLTGIHTGNYGAEFEHYKFSDLLEELVQMEGLERLRISSIEMNEINDKVLEVMKNSSVIVDHLHIPLQSGSDSVLKRMHRKYNKSEFIDKIEKIRKIRPLMSITTDVIVGFPGETDEEFLETIDTIQKVKFSKLHVFPYSKRDQTKAALMPNQVNGIIKKQRVSTLLELSKKLELDYMNQFIQKEVVFLPETEKDGNIMGHTGNYLFIKMKGSKQDLNQDKKAKIVKIEYPYCISE